MSGSLILVALSLIGPPTREMSGHIATGEVREVVMMASHYGGPGDNFNGKQMANGEIFDANNPELAAHKNLPFGTKVKLTNPENGKSQMVVVKDRGPFVRHRDLDISFAAARKLGIADQGVAKLKAVIIH